jgi:hypothetical protein
MRGAGDAQGCLEVQAYGRTPLLLPGDVLDGVIEVGESVLVAAPAVEWFPGAECDCDCHAD